jgi:hypothetical protein
MVGIKVPRATKELQANSEILTRAARICNGAEQQVVYQFEVRLADASG